MKIILLIHTTIIIIGVIYAGRVINKSRRRKRDVSNLDNVMPYDSKTTAEMRSKVQSCQYSLPKERHIAGEAFGNGSTAEMRSKAQSCQYPIPKERHIAGEAFDNGSTAEMHSKDQSCQYFYFKEGYLAKGSFGNGFKWYWDGQWIEDIELSLHLCDCIMDYGDVDPMDYVVISEEDAEKIIQMIDTYINM